MSGPAFMAIQARVPLVPMAIVGTYELLPMHTRHFFPTNGKAGNWRANRYTAYSGRQVEELTERLKMEIGRLYYAHSHLVAVPALDSKEKTLA